jgi:hypothetical protein
LTEPPAFHLPHHNSLEKNAMSQDQIRALNDDLRKNLFSGRVLITAGIAELGPAAVLRLVQTIATFDDFCRANDPHEEHDFGMFEFDGRSVAFKIDYYDKAMSAASPNPADPAVTERLITLMLAEEY